MWSDPEYVFMVWVSLKAEEGNNPKWHTAFTIMNKSYYSWLVVMCSYIHICPVQKGSIYEVFTS